MHIKLKYIISQSAYHRNRRINSLILSVIIKKINFLHNLRLNELGKLSA